MRRLLIFAALVAALALPHIASAQTPVLPGDRLGWDQSAPSLADAQSYTYLIQIDGAVPVAASSVTCSGASSPFTCSAPFPAATPGVQHSVTVAARRVVNGSNLDSDFAVPLVFRLEVVPGTPVNLRRVGSGGEEEEE